MWGRFALNAKVDTIIREFVADGGDFREWTPRYSIAPTQDTPIVRERANPDTGEFQRTVDAAIWDFRPAFMKDSKRPNFNTRIKTVATNGLRKGAFASARALFPMRGYFEWTGTAGNKQPHFLHSQDGALLAAAGIYTARKVEDEWQVSASIITRPARDASGEIHDRMPVFLESTMWDEYLSPGQTRRHRQGRHGPTAHCRIRPSRRNDRELRRRPEGQQHPHRRPHRPVPHRTDRKLSRLVAKWLTVVHSFRFRDFSGGTSRVGIARIRNLSKCGTVNAA